MSPHVLMQVLRHPLRALLALPEPLLRRVTGPEVHNDRGDALDLQIHAVLAAQRRLGLPTMHGVPVARSRRQMQADTALAGAASVAMARVTDGTLPGPGGPLPTRHYDPGGLAETAPLLLYLHGGGFVIGDLETHDALCRTLAAEARCRVLALDYRLAPEHPWPAGPEDAWAAWQHVHAHAAEFGADPDRVVVAGDSAGGNLSALVCLRATQTQTPAPCGQLLIYPGIDLTRAMASHTTFAEGYLLEAATIDFFMDHYAADPQDPGASPWFAAEVAGQPPAVVVTAGFDPLRDEGEAWAERLREAGVVVRARCEGSLVHGFANMDGVSAEARAATLRLADDLRWLFTGAPSEETSS